jgi:hypothetical protein
MGMVALEENHLHRKFAESVRAGRFDQQSLARLRSHLGKIIFRSLSRFELKRNEALGLFKKGLETGEKAYVKAALSLVMRELAPNAPKDSLRADGWMIAGEISYRYFKSSRESLIAFTNCLRLDPGRKACAAGLERLFSLVRLQKGDQLVDFQDKKEGRKEGMKELNESLKKQLGENKSGEAEEGI